MKFTKLLIDYNEHNFVYDGKDPKSYGGVVIFNSQFGNISLTLDKFMVDKIMQIVAGEASRAAKKMADDLSKEAIAVSASPLTLEAPIDSDTIDAEFDI